MVVALVVFAVVYLRQAKEPQPADAVQQQEPLPAGPEVVQPVAEQEPVQESFVLVKGVSLSPLSYDQFGLYDFVGKAKKAATMVGWVGDWNDFSDPDGAPHMLASMSSRYNYIPLVQAQPFNQGTGRFLRPFDDAVKQRYKDRAVSFVTSYKPKYFGMGVEVNVFREKDPQGFDDFVAFYNDAYAAVKAASPETKVFTAFQLEKMKGLRGGLFGGANDESTAEWELIDRFSSDIVAFTTYPGLVYKSPSDLPDDYYSDILTHTDKPIAFTESGWHAAASPVGWESSGEEQAEFVGKFLAAMQDVKPEFAVWSFVYDPETFEPFNSMGLITRDGIAREGWDVWTG